MGQKKSFTNLFNLVAPWLIGLIVWTVIVRGMFPLLLRPISLHAFSGFAITGPVLFFAVLGAFFLPERVRSYVVIPLITLAFASALSGLYATTSTSTIYISGLLPYSDAASYYWDALNLQSGRLFSDFASRRPMFATLLSFLLTMLQNNLMAVQSALTLLTTISIILASLEIRRRLGAIAASLFVVLVLFFYRMFIGSTMTENLGILLGCLGLAILLNSATRSSHDYSLLGLGCLTLGLIARAGPFFAVAGLAAWFAMAFYKKNWLHRGLGLLLALTLVATAFGINKVIGLQTNSPGGVAFANFSYSLYGLSVGGERWDVVFADHPELNSFDVVDRTALVYRYVLENVSSHPELLIKGIIRQYGYLFSPTWYNMFGYVHTENPSVRLAAQYSLMLLSLLGIIIAIKRRNNPIESMLLLLWLGILLSVPFVPPVDTNRMRAYATVIPYLALMPGIGLNWLMSRLPIIGRFDNRIEQKGSAPIGATVFLSLIVTVLLISPSYIKLQRPDLSLLNPNCENGSKPFVMRVPDGSFVNIRKESDFFLDRTPQVHAGRFRQQMHSMPFMDAVQAFETLESPLILTTGADILTGNVAWLTIPVDGFVPSEKPVVFCGQWETRSETMGSAFFNINYILNN